MPTFEAGAASVVITPPVGTDLAGYGGRKGGCTGVHDDLFAKSLVLRQNGATYALITTDLLGLNAATGRDIRRRIRQRTGIPSARVIIVSSHTHSGPVTDLLPTGIGMGTPDLQYMEMLKQNIVEAVEAAMANLQPAKIGCAKGNARINVNRRHQALSECSKPQSNLGGVIDEEVGVVRIVGCDDSVLAHVVNYGCHGVVLGRDNLKVSADYPGVVQRKVEDAFGGVALFTNGACGDINSMIQGGSFTDMKRLGGKVGAEAISASAGIEPFPDPLVSMSKRDVALPCRKPSERELRAIVKREERRLEEAGGGQLKEGESSFSVMWLTWAREMLRRRSRGVMAPSVKVAVRSLTIGPLALVAVPFEVFAETGLLVKRASPYAFTYALTYGDGLLGYLPTREAMAEGGYETWGHIVYGTQPFLPAAESVLRREIQTLLVG